MKWALAVGALIICVVFNLPRTGVVVNVVDGDTIDVLIRGKVERVRLRGVDAPESVHPDPSRNVPEGKVAARRTRRALLGLNVTLHCNRSRGYYGRLICDVETSEGIFKPSW